MTTPNIKVKVQKKPTLKLKVLPQFPANIDVTNFLTVTKANGTYTFGVDYTKLGVGTPASLSTAYVVVLDQAAGIYEIMPLSAIAGGTPGGTNGQVQVNVSGAFGGITFSGDATLNSGTGVLTLATVNSNVGSFGSATATATFTVDGKGRLTAAGSTTVTPAVGSVTGLGTNVAAFLATPSSANLRAALTDETGTGIAYFVGGALSTPASGTLTNCTAFTLTTTGTSGAATYSGGALNIPQYAGGSTYGFITAAQYGVTGDGSTDDTTNLQSFFNALEASPFLCGWLIGTSGVFFKISSVLQIGSGVKVIGCGWNTEIRPTFNGSVIKSKGTNTVGVNAIFLEDFAIIGKTATVTGITKANPAVVTCSGGHSFANGETIRMINVGGMSQVVGTTYTVANKTATTFELSGINSTGFTTFTSGGDVIYSAGVGLDLRYSSNHRIRNIKMQTIQTGFFKFTDSVTVGSYYTEMEGCAAFSCEIGDQNYLGANSNSNKGFRTSNTRFPVQDLGNANDYDILAAEVFETCVTTDSGSANSQFRVVRAENTVSSGTVFLIKTGTVGAKILFQPHISLVPTLISDSGTGTVFVNNGQLQGTTTNDNAGPGKVGEFVTGNLLRASATTLVTGTPKTVVSISLTAGDWNVWGIVGYLVGASTASTQFFASTSTTTNANATFDSGGLASLSGIPGGSGDLIVQAPQVRLSIASTTTVYLVATCNFTSTAPTAYGTISARRVR